MSMKRSFLSRRIIHRSFGISKSESLNPRSGNECRDLEGEGKREERNNGGNQPPQRHGGAGLTGPVEPGSWAGMLPELLGEIMERVETTEENWPQRQNLVACAGVCKRWRESARDAVEKASLGQPGKITFPSSLKRPGPPEAPIQCLIKRDKKNATFYLYLALSPSFTEKGKFLLAARRHRSGAHAEYIVSLDPSDLSQGSKSYVGKLRSDFLGTNFTIYDSQSPHVGAKPSSRRVANKQISPQVPSANFEVGHVSYKLNLLKSRGPRRMVCSLTYPGDETKTQVAKKSDCVDYYTVLRNKAPRWHQHLECWCLNFHGRVTIASVKNFQMVATVDRSKPDGKGDEETVLLQFGKVGSDVFTMDFRRPLSAFQAFAICLTSFGTKLACE